MDSWEILISNSTLSPAPGIDSWAHLNNQGGGGTTRLPAYISDVTYSKFSAELSKVTSFATRYVATLSAVVVLPAGRFPAQVSAVVVVGSVYPGTLSNQAKLGSRGVAGLSDVVQVIP